MRKALLIFAIMASSLSAGKAYNVKTDFAGIIHRMEIREMKSTTFSVDNLVKYLKLKNAPDPKIMISQFIVETGWFKSKLFLRGNNICGMKLAHKRVTTATGEMFGYASFSHWTDSVDDFLLWLQYHGLYNGYFDHVQKKSYSENSGYCKLVLKVHKQFKHQI